MMISKGLGTESPTGRYGLLRWNILFNQLSNVGTLWYLWGWNTWAVCEIKTTMSTKHKPGTVDIPRETKLLGLFMFVQFREETHSDTNPKLQLLLRPAKM